MLWHVHHYWPSGCRYAFNIYQHWKVSVLRGATEVVHSKEGVTQGDPMAIFLYSLGILPIIIQLKHHQQDVESLNRIVEQLQACYKRMVSGPLLDQPTTGLLSRARQEHPGNGAPQLRASEKLL
eukprot:27313-Ditylum_brightwellii.AAC.1